MLTHRIVTTAVAAALALVLAGSAWAQDRATPQEVMQRVRQAAQDIAKAGGEAGLAPYHSKSDASVWKDSYLFVIDCTSMTTAAHPIRQELEGKRGAEILTFGPKPGDQIYADWCAAGRKPQGGWSEYNFPKPGEQQPSRKVAYFVAAQGTPYVVGAGLYDDAAKVEDLDKLAGQP